VQRRQFLASSFAASTLAAATTLAPAALHAEAAPAAQPAPEYYLLRRYNMVSGLELKLTENYFAQALLPALKRMGLGPVGAFKLDIGENTPAYFLLVPGPNATTLAELDLTLAADPQFMAAAEPFWQACSSAAAFQSLESSLFRAFAGWPRLTPLASAASKGKRILQLRTYQSPSNLDHVRKVEMFHAGEFDLFRNAGFHPVFFGDLLVGAKQPNLTYMLAFNDTAQLEAQWNVFRTDPAWKKLSADPRFAFDPIVSNISNLFLSPLDCSQI